MAQLPSPDDTVVDLSLHGRGKYLRGKPAHGRGKYFVLSDFGYGAEVAFAADLYHAQAAVHFLNGLVAVNGGISMQDTVNKSLVCGL